MNLFDIPKTTTKRIAIAYVVAVAADAIDVLITGGEDVAAPVTGGLSFVPGEILSGMLDIVVMAIMWVLLGFHWLFLPSFLVEIIPEIEMFPTWVACVTVVVIQRKKEELVKASLPPPPALNAGRTTPPKLP